MRLETRVITETGVFPLSADSGDCYRMRIFRNKRGVRGAANLAVNGLSVRAARGQFGQGGRL